VRALRLLADALAAARSSGNARLELESALLRFVLQGEDPSLDALAARVTALESGGAAPPRVATVRAETPAPRTPPPAESPAPPQPPAAEAPPSGKADGPLTLQKLRSLWSSIRTRAEEVKPSLNAPLSRAIPESVADATIVLRIPIPPMAEVVKRELSTLKRAIADVTGQALDVRVLSGAGAPPPDAGNTNGGEEPGDDPGELLDYALRTLPAR